MSVVFLNTFEDDRNNLFPYRSYSGKFSEFERSLSI